MGKTLRHVSALAAILLCTTSQLIAQNCTVNDLKLNSQSAVNDFNSSCKFIKGNITISGSDITSLSPLANIESIDGNLTIQNNSSLTSLTGLGKLASVKNLLIYTNDLLTNLSGLQGLKSASGQIHVRFHKALTSLTGLDNLTSASSIYITNNDVLPNLSGLGSLTSVTDLLSVGSCKSLTSLSGVSSLTSVARIIMGDNEILTSLSGLDALESVTWQMQVNQNKALTSLTGLTNLKYLSEIYITGNDVLPNLSGLENVGGVSWIVVGENKKITSLTGLENLLSAGNMVVRGNTILTGLSGLENINSLGWLQISNNPELTSLAALGSSSASGRMAANQRTAATTITSLSITNNPKLTQCAIQPVCDLLKTGTATVSGNGTGCESEAAIEISCAALPVELVSFTATEEGRSAMLHWETAEERNSAFFEIEHSLTGKSWQKIGEETAKGESNDVAKYTWIHHGPARGMNYYRLKMIDADGTFAMSGIAELNLKNSTAGMVFPNPVSDRLHIDAAEDIVRVKIVDLQGTTVYQTDKVSREGISLKRMVAGAYQVQITGKSGLVRTERVIIF